MPVSKRVDSIAVSASTRLEWIVRALAQAPATQVALYPHFVCVGDELAQEFGECLEALRDSGENDELLAVEGLGAIDRKLTEMSDAGPQALWLDEATLSGREWSEVRALANALIRTMGWESSPPPFERGAFYVGPNA